MTIKINKSIQFLVLIVLMGTNIFGQYWQQYVEYEMDVYLDADAKTLSASSMLTYVNNSPDSLNQIYMHLYHNAFNEGTIAEAVWGAFAEYFPDGKGWTGISIQAVTTDSSALSYLIRDDSILDISLPKALAPGDTLRFNLKWLSKIHPHIDRSGWAGNQFDFAQWYPKFVVYDESGWHDDPFGDWGEFYGEFGNFRVNMDLPESQIVGATGIVVDGDPGWSSVQVDTSLAWDEWLSTFEIDRAKSLAALDSLARRQVSFFAENVHDFAWLCSPEFVYEHGAWEGGDVHALFTTDVGQAWTRDVVEDGISALRWLSSKFGAYPWPQMTITKALLSGGMEYPMLIMDASDSESLIVHEIGHNWFYGLFGNDELDDAWLDEGFTSFQTTWYKTQHYPQNGYDITRDNITTFENENLPRQFYWEAAFKPALRYMKSPRNEPIATRSYDFKYDGSYRSNVYTKASVMLTILKSYLGEETFLAGMTLYYERWALKHVNEDRFIECMEDVSGEELDWFFDQWLHTSKTVDYALSDWNSKSIDDYFQTHIIAENKGGLFVPMTATIYGKNGESETATIREFRHRQFATIDITSNFRPHQVILDAENIFFDTDRRNNTSHPKFALRYNYKGWDAYPGDRTLYLWNPQFGYNDDDGLGLGLRLDRVYRNTGDFTTLTTDYNLLSQKSDLSLSFKKLQTDLPFRGTWSGKAGSWHGLGYADLAFELNWANQFWLNPIHYLTIQADFTDGGDLPTNTPSRSSFTRLGLRYELQHDLFGGDYGLSLDLKFSPASLGGYGKAFSQLYLMDSWSKNIGFFKFENRSNLMLNARGTPEYVRYRVASQDLRSTHIDRNSSTWNQISDIDKIGSRYYLMGGARMRAYSDSLNFSVNYMWSNNTDLTFKTSLRKPKQFDLGIFMDIGQYSLDAEKWYWLSDLGFNFTYKPDWKRNGWISTLVRPVQVKVQVPLIRYAGGHFESANSSELWVFTFSK